MAYTLDLQNAARRHLRAAATLYAATGAGAQPGCKVVAGYLFGLAGELAVKQMMRDSGMRPLSPERRRDDPFYAHFPELKRLLLDQISGRRAGQLRAVAQSGRIFRQWHTDMRYAPSIEVPEARVEEWKADANELVNQMGAP
ncbi:hypothetical protein [Pseudorhodoferax sp. Leaf267]|uniref:hypothetical protein n=1 Tax=Pseudorhodoferax sp. Leaf267 TaxID=1736316 RepID=UPI0006F74D21|nr:hypothetical protein [Pseudorhodoferax sp. Leaf267]KQP23099.1 hypothetical protein ASF43_04235 [Pseudorhodoferax sp. Leaf267]